MIVATMGASPVGAKGSADITSTPTGRDRIATAVASFAAQGSQRDKKDFVASQLADGKILVIDRTFNVEATDSGIRVTSGATTDATTTSSTDVTALTAASWSQIRSGCFAALFDGASHFDVCHKQFKMLSDGDGSKDFWRVDFYGTMFAEGRQLNWGWIAVDRDAGPSLSFVDWAPDADYDSNCGSVSLGLSVAGFGISQGGTFCELVDISKSAGASVGWFKEQWSWGNHEHVKDRDRSVKMLVGFSSTQGAGTPVFGLSWSFDAVL